MNTSPLADAWIADDSGIYTHYDHHGRCDDIEIPHPTHVRLHRTGTQWTATITSGTNPTGRITITGIGSEPNP
jgi:hypothetical protein